MKNHSIFIIIQCLPFYMMITACGTEPGADQSPDGLPIDKEVTIETRALFLNLRSVSREGILFGHQDDLAYGVHWKEEAGRSDVKDACGAYPAVFGWDVSKLGQRPFNIDSVDFEKMKEWIKQAFVWGGINTISWHMDNPVTKGDSWDQTPAVYSIIPGGENHEWYKSKLDLFVDFLNDLKADDTFVPVIFRPFHEHTGNWFWWGRGNCSSDEFKTLWKFTVNYLKDEKGIHHLLYAYSTDRFKSQEDYLEFYAGDEYVDILAYDDYHSIVSAAGRPELVRQLNIIVKLSDERGKIAALSETGYETIPDDDWWTTVLLPGLTSNATASRIAYMLVWRNARLSHHYAPFDGHPSAADFRKFKEDTSIIFIDEIPVEMYKIPH
jgi:mannan endo-1,4-beta-mannosidase